jgi:hypothetical protein
MLEVEAVIKFSRRHFNGDKSVFGQCLGRKCISKIIGLFARLRRQRDLAPDYLGLCRGLRFECDGFCFTVSLECQDETATFTVMYQNRHTGPAVARVSLRPAGSRLAIVSPLIDCGPAGFGVVKFPLAIPARHQGKTVRFEIAARADYPQGKGREVCFRRGRTVPHDACFDNPPETMRALPHSWAAHILNHAAATIRLTLPSHVAEYVSDDVTGHVEELWSLRKNQPLGHATYSSRSA